MYALDLVRESMFLGFKVTFWGYKGNPTSTNPRLTDFQITLLKTI